LAAGVMGDDARIDEELLFIRAVADIDEMHIRLLARMVNPADMPPGWSAFKIEQADPGLRDGIRALLVTLELHGLIAAVVPGSPIRGSGAGQTFYNITESGRRFLDRLADGSDGTLFQGAT